MSYSYDKYKTMTPEQLQKEIDERKVTPAYLNWLGIAGPGAQLRRIAKDVTVQSIAAQKRDVLP
jgi:hypothetical protein